MNNEDYRKWLQAKEYQDFLTSSQEMILVYMDSEHNCVTQYQGRVLGNIIDAKTTTSILSSYGLEITVLAVNGHYYIGSYNPGMDRHCYLKLCDELYDNKNIILFNRDKGMPK